MSYWTYYLLWFLLAYGVRQPWLLGGILVFLILRQWIPDPSALFRAFRRGRDLRIQVALNAANVTARRDLATIYLDLRRPQRALALVEEALVRDPDSAELLYLKGLALQRLGHHSEATAPLVRAVELNPTLRWGEPFRVAGDALFAMRRYEEAIDAYERLARINSSDVGAHVALARAHAKVGDRQAARASVHAAIATFHQIPGRLRRRAFGAWLDSQWLRMAMLREPSAIAAALAIAAAVGMGAWYGAPLVRRAAAAPRAPARPVNDSPRDEALFDGFRRCGSQSTGDFEGQYVLEEDSLVARGRLDGTQSTDAEYIARQRDAFSHFRVRRDRITSGTKLVQDFCLTRILESTAEKLHAEAVWHEDIHDPGDASLVEIWFEKIGGRYRFALSEPGDPSDKQWLLFRRGE